MGYWHACEGFTLPSLAAQVSLQGAALSEEAAAAAARAGLATAAAAAAAHASLAEQRSGSGTGEMLRCNFVLVADSVQEHDGHLLSAAEVAMIARFKVGRSFMPPCIPCIMDGAHLGSV
jgi:hypothetical protein